MDTIVDHAYKIADKYEVILKGHTKISGDINCLLFAHYCDSTIFYKHFLTTSRDIFRVNKKCNQNLKHIKRLIIKNGYKKVWTKGVFSIYGDLRPLAVAANLGKWGENGLIENQKYGSNFLISAVFYK
ncbi:MAG: hypothetical protein RR515_02985 [Clostridium sp.]